MAAAAAAVMGEKEGRGEDPDDCACIDPTHPPSQYKLASTSDPLMDFCKGM
jgi:hypothetical protein